MPYDKAYRESENLFGENPENILVKYYNLLNKKYPVVDIGCGQGRNTFFLAEKGFVVEAIDPSAVAVQTVAEKTAKQNLSVSAYQSSFEDLLPSSEFYSGILVFGLLQILSWEEIDSLINKSAKWATLGTLTFITAFSTEDVGFSVYSKKWKSIGKNSFSNGQEVRTFFEKDELKEMFNNYELIHYWESLGPEHSHGKGSLEQHSMIELVVRK